MQAEIIGEYKELTRLSDADDYAVTEPEVRLGAADPATMRELVLAFPWLSSIHDSHPNRS